MFTLHMMEYILQNRLLEMSVLTFCPQLVSLSALPSNPLIIKFSSSFLHCLSSFSLRDMHVLSPKSKNKSVLSPTLFFPTKEP